MFEHGLLHCNQVNLNHLKGYKNMHSFFLCDNYSGVVNICFQGARVAEYSQNIQALLWETAELDHQHTIQM